MKYKKSGESMIAIILAIIDLIALTVTVPSIPIEEVEINGLASFYSNIDTVQDLVSLTMGDNMIDAALNGYGENYKWVGIVKGYTEKNAKKDPLGDIGFVKMENAPTEYLIPIDSDLLKNALVAEKEITKYYIDDRGRVYYEGFEYNGNTYYNKDTVVKGYNKLIKPYNEPLTVTITTDSEITNAESITYVIKFNRSVIGFTMDDITINGTKNKTEILGNGTTYTLTVPTQEKHYTQSIKIPANACEDMFGNKNEKQGIEVLVDRVKPVITSSTKATEYSITIKATDKTGIIGYAISENNIEPKEFISCKKTTSLTQEVKGKIPGTIYYVWVKDAVGNVSVSNKVITQKVTLKLTAKDVAANPMSYYGAKVNYTAGGESNWRIFYADGDNIYITTERPVDVGEGLHAYYGLNSRDLVMANLRKNDGRYVNNTYADDTKTRDGITYEMFKNSYNQVRRSNAKQNLSVDEKGIVTNASNSLSRLTGTLQEDLYVWTKNNSLSGYNYYWLASASADELYHIECVNCFDNNVYSIAFTQNLGLRPLVCLKYNVALIENNGTYDLKIDKNIPNPQPIFKGLTAKDVAANPMSYYGAKVNYTAGGESNWRIFYADRDNIYITTERPIDVGEILPYYYGLNSRDLIMANLRKNDGRYVNNTYADDTKTRDGITYEMFKNSYNQVRRSNAEQNLSVDANGIVANASNSLSRLTGTLQEDLYVWTKNNSLSGYNYYWLASASADELYHIECVNCFDNNVYSIAFTKDCGLRPLVCLKSDVQLVENNGKYDLKIDKNIPNPQPISKGLISKDVAVNPMLYYGARVNYKDVNGSEFELGQGKDNIYWRIFYSDGDNIYLTTNKSVSSTRWVTKDEAMIELTKKGIKYVNYNYASWSQDGITYAMFKDSYNQVIGNNGLQNLEGNETNGYTVQTNSILPLTGTLQENLYSYSNNWYWLASPIANSKYSMVVVAKNRVTFDDYYYNNEIRPIVCLKSNVQLIESGVKDSNGYMTYNLSL